ncbi:MAG: EamA family transporter, partial [Acidimicrobiales bacterium]
FTTYFVLTRAARLTTAVDPIEWMTAINVWAFVSILPVALVVSDWSDLTSMQGRDWFWLVVLSYLTGVLGHVLMSWAHGYIEASRSSLSVLLMNIVAVSLAWPVHDEPVTWVQGIGGVIALGAVAMVLRIPPVART